MAAKSPLFMSGETERGVMMIGGGGRVAYTTMNKQEENSLSDLRGNNILSIVNDPDK